MMYLVGLKHLCRGKFIVLGGGGGGRNFRPLEVVGSRRWKSLASISDVRQRMADSLNPHETRGTSMCYCYMFCYVA
jgi:hypothetical protein